MGRKFASACVGGVADRPPMHPGTAIPTSRLLPGSGLISLRPSLRLNPRLPLTPLTPIAGALNDLRSAL